MAALASNVSSLTKFDENYALLEVIGSGTAGIVYKAKDCSTKEIVAIKRLRILLTEEGLPFTVLREISLLRYLAKFNHENIVKMMSVELGSRSLGEQQINLIFEYLEKDLYRFLKEQQNKPLPFQQSLNLVRQLLADGSTLKLTDFGLARLKSCSVQLTSGVVTVWYRAPEIFLRLPHYDESIDIWSAGCVIAEIFLLFPLFSGTSEIDTLNRIFDVCGMPDEDEWPSDAAFSYSSCYSSSVCPNKLSSYLKAIANEELENIIKNMLEFSPNKRLRIADILNKRCFTPENSEFTSAQMCEKNWLSGKLVRASVPINTSNTSLAHSRYFAKSLENNDDLLINRQTKERPSTADVIILSSDSSSDDEASFQRNK